jgi:hypothetical protein
VNVADRARVLLDAYASSYADPDGECAHDCDDHRGRQAPKAFAALRAVLDVHKPVAIEGTKYCGACRNPTYPCATVRAIATALEAS